MPIPTFAESFPRYATARDRIVCPGVATRGHVVTVTERPGSDKYPDTPVYVTALVACDHCERTTSIGVPADRLDLAHIGWHLAPNAKIGDILRACCARGQHGWPRTARNFYVSSKPGTSGGNYWARQSLNGGSTFGITEDLPDEKLAKVVRLLHRYQRYYRLATEVWPGWVEVDRTYWADNSIDSNQVDKNGNKRSVQLTAPHGDVCF